MKTCQALMLLAFLLSIAACKKESAPQPLSNTIAQEGTAAASAQTNLSFNPANFVSVIDNPYYPLTPGTTKYYVKKMPDGANIVVEHITVEVTKDIKVILGVTCKVIHDQVTENGTVTEDTYDWYAQDKHGNVWYFGESTRSLTDTGWSTLGSWEAGVNGAVQGIIMPGHPGKHVGETYYQEYYAGSAEDQATLVSANSTATINLGTYTHCVETKEFTRLDPGKVSKKFYAPGIGEILAVQVQGGKEREELVAIKRSR